MFRFFENLVDPYVDYKDTNTPPKTLFGFISGYAQPFKKLFVVTGVSSVLVAAVEIWLIAYMGRMVDMLSNSSPATFWDDHGTELLLMVLFIMTLRPLLQGIQVALLNNSILPNFGTLVRWRAHKHVLRQSVGWFENDFAGRIANRIMQTPPAAGEVVFQLFDAIAFAIAYVIGAAILLGDADPRLVVPMLLWLGPYILLVRWVIKQISPASEAASNARSAVTGRVVDSYTNIHSVKMFAHHDRELNYAKDAIEEARRTFQIEMRLFTFMDLALVLLNGFLIRGGRRRGALSVDRGHRDRWGRHSSTALALRLNAMSGWIMWAVSNFFRELGVVSEGDANHRPANHAHR